MRTKYYKAADAEALAVLIRYAESEGAKVCQVRPINDYFAVQLQAPENFEITNQTNLKAQTVGLPQERTYWAEIVEVSPECVEFLGVFGVGAWATLSLDDRMEAATINLCTAAEYFESEVLDYLEVTEENLVVVEQALDKLAEVRDLFESM